MLVWREAFYYPLGSGPLLAANDGAVRNWRSPAVDHFRSVRSPPHANPLRVDPGSRSWL